MTFVPPSFTVDVTDEAKELLRVIGKNDKRIASKLADLMEDLSLSPDQKGLPLGGELTGLYSRHAIGNRFRIIYKIDLKKLSVSVLSVGIRRAGSHDDVYEVTKRVLKRKRG